MGGSKGSTQMVTRSARWTYTCCLGGFTCWQLYHHLKLSYGPLNWFPCFAICCSKKQPPFMVNEGCVTHTRVSSLIQPNFGAELVGYFVVAYNTFHVRWVSGASLELVWRFEQRTFCFGSFGWGGMGNAKTTLVPLMN